MKYLSVLLFSLLLIGMAGSALAGAVKNDIMHCGCVYVAEDETDGIASMEWKQLSIQNGKGHRNHVIDQSDDCLSGYAEIVIDEVTSYDPLYTTFYRDFDDCLIAGPLDFLDPCDNPETTDDETPVEGADCGFELD